MTDGSASGQGRSPAIAAIVAVLVIVTAVVLTLLLDRSQAPQTGGDLSPAAVDERAVSTARSERTEAQTRTDDRTADHEVPAPDEPDQWVHHPLSATLVISATLADGTGARKAALDVDIIARHPISMALLGADDGRSISERLQRMESDWERAQVEDRTGRTPTSLDGKGRATVLVHTPGLYRVSVTAAGHARATAEVDVPAGSDREVSLSLQSGAMLRASTIGAGELVPETTVVFVDVETGEERTAISGANGRVAFDHLHPYRRARLMGYKVIEEGTWQSRWTEVVLKDAGHVAEVTVDLGKREAPLGRFTEVEGVVIDARTGAPITEGWVAGLTGGDLDERGRFQVQPIPDPYTQPLTGTFQVTADDYRTARVRATLDPPEQPAVRLQPMLEGETQVTFQVTDAAGNPLSDVVIEGDVEIRGESGVLDLASFSLPPSDHEGRSGPLSLGLRDREVARVEAGASTHQGAGSVVALVPQGRRDDLLIKVGQEGTVSGLVVLPDGTPASDFSVIAAPAGDPLSTIVARTTAGPDGTFTLQSAPIGPLALVVRGPLFGAVESIEVPSGGRSDLRITLSPLREVRITATDASSGDRIAGLHIDAGAQGWARGVDRVLGPASATFPVFAIAEGYRTTLAWIPPDTPTFSLKMDAASR